MNHIRAALLLSLGLGGAARGGQELTVLSVEPAARALTVPAWANVTVHFDRPVDPATVTPQSFRAFGRWSGVVSGTHVLSNGDQTVTLVPDHPFSWGEQVMVCLSHDLRGADASPLRGAGYSFQFWTRARPANLSFAVTQVLSTNIVASSRPYGGVGSDMNGDGWLDITCVNEDTADLRVFLNQADGSGLYQPFIQPPFPVNIQASPSEPADFDGDGHVDICVANISTDTVSILLGTGDGTLGPQQQITVGDAPRGIAVLDADGDGDLDIANTNSNPGGPGNLSLLVNNGSGVFAAPVFFATTASNEYALAAGDMNEDGILDLVVGARTPERILVLRGNGNGTFTQIEDQSAGVAVWVLVLGDVNGDGHEDVATAGSTDNRGSILLGDGTGQLGTPATVISDSFPLSADLGDMDGDGDLDWALSCFSGDWQLFVNNGAGSFSFGQEFNAPSAASCTIMLDIDNDRDLDLALLDEIADVIHVTKNSGTASLADVNNDGVVNVQDLTIVITGWGPCGLDDPCAGDVTGDGVVDVQDLVAVILAWT